MRDLKLHGARLVAGYAHERQDLATQLPIRGFVEAAIGGPADVSTSCGLGRRENAGAAEAMDRIATLLRDRPRAGRTPRREAGVTGPRRP